MKLWSENLGGNLHQSCSTINDEKFWVKFTNVVAMSYNGGNYTIVVFEVSDEEYERLRNKYHAKPYPLPTTNQEEN